MKQLLAVLLLLMSCVFAGPVISLADEPELDDLLVEPAVIELGPGEEADLKVTGLYDDGSTADLTGAVSFDSEDEDVVIVVGSTVIAVGDGDTEIRVEHLPTGVRTDDPPQVTVWEILELTIAPTAVTIEVGEDVRLSALAELEDGRMGFDVTGVVEWESSEEAVAVVSNGLVDGLSAGEADIQVRDPASGTESEDDAAVVTVEPAPDPNAELLEVIASPEAAAALIGDVVALTVLGEFDDDTIRDITSEVTYQSNRPAIASVDSAGRVYALSPGTASIRVDHVPSGRSTSDRPEIWVGEMEQLHLSPASAQLMIAQELPLAALATFDNGLGADVSEEVLWSSDQASVAVVSGVAGTRGRVTGMFPGTANISAVHGVTGIASPVSEGEITVLAPTPTPGPSATPTPEFTPFVEQIRDLVFDPAIVRLLPGDSAPLLVTAVHHDGSMTDVTDRVVLRVRNRGVATIDSGVVTAWAEGRTTVHAHDPLSGRSGRMKGRIEVTRMLRLRISPARTSLLVGEQGPFTALADFDDGQTNVDVTARVVWDVASGAGIGEVDDGINKGLATGLSDGLAVLRVVDPVSGMSSDATTGRLAIGSAPVEDPAELVGLRFDPSHLVVAKRADQVFSVEGVLVDGSTVPIPIGDLQLRSAQRRVAHARASGLVRGRRPGIATIEVVHPATGVTAWLPVTVRSHQRIVVDPASNVVEVGQVIDLGATATYNDGTGPFDETATLRWRSLDPDLAELDGDVPGRVIARAEGIAIIEASDRGSRTRSDAKSGVVHVVTGLVSVSVEPRAVALSVAGTQVFQALGHYSDGSVVDLTSEVDWSVGSTAVASIARGALVRANADGDTRVIATHRDTGIASVGLERAVVVVGRTLVGFQVSPEPGLRESPRRSLLDAGQTARLYGLGLLDGGGVVDRTDDLLWFSTNPTAVAVTQSGLVTCRSIGSSSIFVIDPAPLLTSTDTLGDTTVRCHAASVARIEVRPKKANVDYPDGRNLRSFRIYTDGHEVDVTAKSQWTSGDPAALSVESTGPNGGRVTGLDDGIVTVTAYDVAFGFSAEGVITARKVRVDLRIFESVPEADKDGVFRGQVGEPLKLKARVEYASGATQGVNQIPTWTSSNPAVLAMGADAGLQPNWGQMVGVGTATITATWPADEFSAELTDIVEIEVEP
ncbi:MAG: Ig-like domain-containing protein [Candidatus Binatia bacterium]|nr:Ig-like domain-containing protein [Candidatus Binatia bacterium]